MRNLILGGVLRGILMIQLRLVPRKSIFDLFGQKWPARMVTVNKDRYFKTKNADICTFFGSINYVSFLSCVCKIKPEI